MAEQESRWVVAPDEVNIEIKIGPEARLPAEMRQALETIARMLEQRSQAAPGMTCGNVSSGPCAVLVVCQRVEMG